MGELPTSCMIWQLPITVVALKVMRSISFCTVALALLFFSSIGLSKAFRITSITFHHSAWILRYIKHTFTLLPIMASLSHKYPLTRVCVQKELFGNNTKYPALKLCLLFVAYFALGELTDI